MAGAWAMPFALWATFAEAAEAECTRPGLAPARARYKYTSTPSTGCPDARKEKGAFMRKFLTVRIEVKINVAACLAIALLVASILI